jgi:hypothetical protein
MQHAKETARKDYPAQLAKQFSYQISFKTAKATTQDKPKAALDAYRTEKLACYGSWWRKREEIEGKDARVGIPFLLSLQAGDRTSSTAAHKE